MNKLKLTYFDFAGRAEVARLALTIGGIEFEDHRLSLEEWPNFKDQTPFRSIPILEVDGEILTQSNTINRYVGKLADLYPADPWKAALCDQVLDAIEDILCQIVVTFSMADEEKKQARQDLVKGPIPLFLTSLQSMLEKNGGQYFTDGRLTVADLKSYTFTQALGSGNWEYIPTDLVEKTAPALFKHSEAIRKHPKIVEYYDK